MKKPILALMLTGSLLFPTLSAASPPGSGNLASGPYAVSGTITTPNPCIVPSGEKVLFAATNSIVLSPGFHAEGGSTFRAVIGNYSSLDSSSDNDGDLLSDWWELLYFGNLNEDGTGDFDGDGVIDRYEILLGSDPISAIDLPSSGSHYEYDPLGRVKNVIQIK